MSGAGVGGLQASGWVVLSPASKQGLLRYLESCSAHPPCAVRCTGLPWNCLASPPYLLAPRHFFLLGMLIGENRLYEMLLSFSGECTVKLRYYVFAWLTFLTGLSFCFLFSMCYCQMLIIILM